jgi:hypothetical protein
MSKDKRKYLEAYIPEVKPKETPKRSGMKSDGRLDEIEEAIRAFNDLLAKQNRDNLDAMYNIGAENLSSSFRRLLQSYDDGIVSARKEVEYWANQQSVGFKDVEAWKNDVVDAYRKVESSLSEDGEFYNEIRRFITDQKFVTETGIEQTINSKVETKVSESLTEDGAFFEQVTSFIKDQGYVTPDGIGSAVSTEVTKQISEDMTESGVIYTTITNYIKTQDFVSSDGLESTISTQAKQQIEESLGEDGAISKKIMSFGYQTEDDVSSTVISAISEYNETLTGDGGSINSLLAFKSEVDAGTNSGLNQTITALIESNKTVSDNGAAVEEFVKWRQETADKAISSIAGLTTAVNNNSDAVARLDATIGTHSDEGLRKYIAELQVTAGEHGSQLSALAEFKSETEKGTLSVISGLTSRVGETEGAISSLQSEVQGENANGWLYKAISGVTTTAKTNGEAISSLQSAVYTKDDSGKQITALSKFQEEVGLTYAKTSQFSTFKSEIEESVSQTLAGFTTEADETYAKTSQFAAILGEDGNVSFAEIAAGVSDDESFVKLVAENIVLDGDVYITGKDDNETMMRIWGNRITLNHLYKEPTGAAITWWYDGIDTGEAIGNIYSDRDAWLDDDLRYSLRLFAGVVDGYPGAIILNSEGAIRQEAGTRICLAAPMNVRIEAQESYFIACTTNFGGIVPEANSFVFCTDGIYFTYLNSDDEIEYECILPITI